MLRRGVLRHHLHSPGVNICHAAFDLCFEVTTAEMDILQGGVSAAMTGEERDLVNVPSTGGEVR
jgi:hypothetical protein